MKLAVSNIAWAGGDLEGNLRLLRELGVDGVELAPSLLWPEPAESTAAQRREARARLESEGLAAVGLHALLFTRRDLTLFESEGRRRQALDYLLRMCELCRDLGGRTLVFGSPPCRRRGALPREEALSIAADFFHEAGRGAGSFGVFMLIEPLTPAETDFIVSAEEGAELVRRADHPHFRLELDGRAMAENREDFSAFSKYREMLMHVQTSDPGLSEPGSKGIDHAPIGRALQKSGYGGFVSLEMRRDPADPKGAIRRGVEALKLHYLGGVSA